jgi:hypothetical protein
MEAMCFSETSVETQRTTWCCIPEDGTLQVMLMFAPLLNRQINEDDNFCGSKHLRKMSSLCRTVCSGYEYRRG